MLLIRLIVEDDVEPLEMAAVNSNDLIEISDDELPNDCNRYVSSLAVNIGYGRLYSYPLGQFQEGWKPSTSVPFSLFFVQEVCCWYLLNVQVGDRNMNWWMQNGILSPTLSLKQGRLKQKSHCRNKRVRMSQNLLCFPSVIFVDAGKGVVIGLFVFFSRVTIGCLIVYCNYGAIL